MNCGHLFNGIGGFALAAHWKGWNNVMHCEIDPFCNRVMKHHFPNSIQHEDIRTTDFTIWRGTIDVLTGGFPCQPYSTAGKRLGKADERHLWPHMLRAIQEISPRWVVGENVRGLTNWNGGLVFDEVQADLEAAGYEVIPFLLPAAGVNAPHERYRVWFVAYRADAGAEGLRRPGQDEIFESRIIADAGCITGDRREGNQSGEGKHYGQNGGREEAADQPEGLCKTITASNACGDGQRGDDGPEQTGCEAKENEGAEQRQERDDVLGQRLRGDIGGVESEGLTSDSSRVREREQANEVDAFTSGGETRVEPGCAGWGRVATNADSHQRCEGGLYQKGSGETARHIGSCDPRYGRTTWEDFPTQPPLCNVYDGISRIMDRNIKKEVYASISQNCTSENLQEMWKFFQSPKVRGEIGRLYKIHEPELLLKTLQLCSTDNQESERLSEFSEEASKDLLRKLRKYKSFANSPQGRKLEKQFDREFTNTLPKLSHEIALGTMEIERAAQKFSSWHRKESLKAAGNAIVPQTVYQIFKAIDEYEKLSA